jgi:UDP-N-acetylglucosamine:LPS N-acetylglucosamine transferase
LKLKPIGDKYQSVFITEKTAFSAPNADYLLMQTDLKDRRLAIKMILNTMYSLFIWVKHRPDFVITTGTMVAYPFYLLAILFKRKFIFIETFGRANMPTVAGEKMEKHADLFVVQWESQKRFYRKAVYVGCLY